MYAKVDSALIDAKQKAGDPFSAFETVVPWNVFTRALVGGGVAGACIGGVMAYALVKVLPGVFDPPPEGLTVPRLYLVFLFVSATSLTAAVVAAHLQDLQSKSVIGELRSDVY